MILNCRNFVQFCVFIRDGSRMHLFIVIDMYIYCSDRLSLKSKREGQIDRTRLTIFDCLTLCIT